MLYLQSQAGFSLFFSCSCLHSSDVCLKGALCASPSVSLKDRVRKVRKVHSGCFSLHLKLDSYVYPITVSFALILEWALSSTSILGQGHLPAVSSPSILYPHQVAMLLINSPEFQTMVVTRNSLFCCAPSLSARKLSSLFNTCFHFKSYSAVKSSLLLSENHKGTLYLTLGFCYWTDCFVSCSVHFSIVFFSCLNCFICAALHSGHVL